MVLPLKYSDNMLAEKRKELVWVPCKKNRENPNGVSTSTNLRLQDRQESADKQLIDNNNDINTPENGIITNTSPVFVIKSTHSFITDRYNPIQIATNSSDKDNSELNKTYHRKIDFEELIDKGCDKDDTKISDLKDLQTLSLKKQSSTAMRTDKSVSINNLQIEFTKKREDRAECAQQFHDFLLDTLSPRKQSITNSNIDQSQNQMKQLNPIQIKPISSLTNTNKNLSESGKNNQNFIGKNEKISGQDNQGPNRQNTNYTVINFETARTETTQLVLSPPKLKLKPLIVDPPLTSSRTALPQKGRKLACTAQNSKTSLTNRSTLKSYSTNQLVKCEGNTKLGAICSARNVDSDVNIDDGKTAREKSYDPEKARQFMEEQKVKRKKGNKNVNAKTNIEKEEIKKRLDELRKNSLKIVAKNVKKAKQAAVIKSTVNLAVDVKSTTTLSGTNVNDIEQAIPETVETMKSLESSVNVAKCAKSNKDNKKVKPPDRGSIHFLNERNVNNAEIIPESTAQEKTEQTNSPKRIDISEEPHSENHIINEPSPQSPEEKNQKSKVKNKRGKRIGILRKLSTDAQEDPIPIDVNQFLDKLISPEIMNESKESEKVNIFVTPNETVDLEKDFELKVPDTLCSLKSSTLRADVFNSLCNKTPDISKKAPTNSRDVPYWLRPTPVQSYPYNFIKAVRKKLESIANPTLPPTDLTSKTLKTPIARPKMSRQSSSSMNFRQNLRNTEECQPRKQTNIYDFNESLSKSKKDAPQNLKGTTFNPKNIQAEFENVTKNEIESKIQKHSSSQKNQFELQEPTDKLTFQSNRTKVLIETINSIPKIQAPEDLVKINAVNKYTEKTKIKPKDKDLCGISELYTNYSCTSWFTSNPNKSSESNSINDHRNVKKNISDVKSNKASSGSTTESIPSTIFSRSSSHDHIDIVHIEAPAPLSIESVQHLKIASKTLSRSMISNLNPDVTFVTITRGTNETMHPNRKKTINNHKLSKEQLDKDVDILEMLETYNRSLHKVINVNQKLHSAFSNQPKTILTDSQVSIESNDECKSAIDKQQIENSKENDDRSTENSNPITLQSIDNVEEYSSSFDIDSIPLNKTSNEYTVSMVPHSSASQHKPANDKTFVRNKNKSSDLEPWKSHLSKSDTETKVKSKPQPLQSIQSSIYPLVSPKLYTNFQESNDECCSQSSIHTAKTDSTQYSMVTSIKESNASADEHSDCSQSSAGRLSNNSIKSQLPAKSRSSEVQKEKLKIDGTTKSRDREPDVDATSSNGSDIYAVFNQTEMEFSLMSNDNQTMISEGNLSYSSIGMYDQLINTETRKSEQLSALIKLREKAVIDRTKGQLAWLAVQKQRYKEQGLKMELTSVKKKQRALLMRLEKERAAMHKLSQMNDTHSSTAATAKSSSNIKLPKSHLDLQRLFKPSAESVQQNKAMKGFEITATTELEKILQKREKELIKRRKNVEHLMEWHQRLDAEEKEVLRMEKSLMKHTSPEFQQIWPSTSTSEKIEGLQAYCTTTDIDEKISAIQNLPTSMPNCSDHFVEVSGSRLNKLWKRLTGESTEKFNRNKRYRVNRKDMERIYEDAKRTVIIHFQNGNEFLQFLDRSSLDSEISFRSNQKNRNDVEEPSSNSNINSDQDSLKSMRNIGSQTTIVQRNLCIDQNEIKTKEQRSIVNDIPTLDLNFSPDRSLSSGADTDELGFYFSQSSSEKKTSVETVPRNINTNSPNYQSENQWATTSIEESVQAELTANESVEDLNQTEKDVISDPTYSSIQSDSLEKFNIVEASVAERDISEITISDNLIKQIKTTNNAPNENTAFILTSPVPFDDTLIENTSFPNVEQTLSCDDVLIVDAALACDTHTVSVIAKEFDDKYLSDDFENISDKTTSHLSDDPKNISKHSIVSNNSEIITSVSNEVIESKLSSSGSQPISDTSSDLIGSTEHCNDGHNCSPTTKSGDLHQRLIDIDVSLKDIQDTLDKSPVMEIRSTSPEKCVSPMKGGTIAPAAAGSDDNKENKEPVLKVWNKNIIEQFPLNEPILSKSEQSSPPFTGKCSKIRDYVSPTEFKISTNKMPDIISEAEVLRRQQLQIEQEIKQLEQSVPLVYLREIPNKPPPPYVPPAHGSPMTTIFPSNERIKEIIFRRMEELYNEHYKKIANASNSSILNEHITNIYERIILDVCRECFAELQMHLAPLSFPYECSTSTSTTSLELHRIQKYKSPLAFYNPPDRLTVIQEYVLKRIMNLLNIGQSIPRAPRIASLVCSRRKRDLVDEILIQELCEEEDKWINFDVEEEEVINSLANDFMIHLVEELIQDIASPLTEDKNE